MGRRVPERSPCVERRRLTSPIGTDSFESEHFGAGEGRGEHPDVRLSSLNSGLFLSDANVPPVDLRAFRLEAEVAGLLELVVSNDRNERSVDVGMDLAPLGHDFHRVPLSDRTD